VAWAAAGRALRPVAEAAAREHAFVCTASHGLVTPLMAVTANCDVLEAEASDQAGLASWVANIRPAADEMATRIADMLMHVGGD
jgi:signal transduction histidine kinase